MQGKELIKFAAQFVKRSKSVLISTGAGMSADSGLSTYRGLNCTWEEQAFYKTTRLSYEEVSSAYYFEMHPKSFWYVMGNSQQNYRKAIPHEGYDLLQRLCREHFKNDYFIFTSNVDGLHQKSGCDPNKICEVHGNMHWVQCDYCGDLAHFDYKLEFDHKKLEVKEIPKCHKCKNPIRPNVFLFQDRWWDMQRYREQEDRLLNFMLDKEEVLVLEIGAGIMVPTVRYTGESSIIADSVKKGTLVRINPDYYPRWMCSVAGDYDYFGVGDTPHYEEYSNIIENGKEKLMVELNMNAIEGVKAILNELL